VQSLRKRLVKSDCSLENRRPWRDLRVGQGLWERQPANKEISRSCRAAWKTWTPFGVCDSVYKGSSDRFAHGSNQQTGLDSFRAGHGQLIRQVFEIMVVRAETRYRRSRNHTCAASVQ